MDIHVKYSSEFLQFPDQLVPQLYMHKPQSMSLAQSMLSSPTSPEINWECHHKHAKRENFN